MALGELYPPEFHPFQVREDEAMKRLADSIRKGGVRVPAIVRPREAGGYELVAGNRRKRGCELAGLSTLPAIIREMDDDEAALVMVDTNLEQRETLLPSERGWAYRLKLEVMNHRGVRSDNPGELSVDALCEDEGIKKSTAYRYIRLTELVPGLIDRVDEKKIKVTAGVELSYLSRKEQAIVIGGIERNDDPLPAQAKLLRAAGADGGLTAERADAILAREQKQPNSLKLADHLIRQYFPASYTPRQMQTVIVKLLEAWHRQKAG
jgi:ParB family chromosome partitioning protein